MQVYWTIGCTGGTAIVTASSRICAAKEDVDSAVVDEAKLLLRLLIVIVDVRTSAQAEALCNTWLRITGIEWTAALHG